MSRTSLARSVAALLLAVSAALFLVGGAAERSAEEDEGSHEDSTITAVVVSETHSEAGENGDAVEPQSEEGASGEGVEHNEESEEAETHADEDERREGAEQADGTSAAPASHSEEGETGEEGEEHDEASEDILGINPESNGAIALAVAASLLLALAVWRRGTPVVLVLAVAFGLLFAAFDVREALHQADESRDGLVALVMLIAGLHAGVAIAAGLALKDRPAGTAVASA